MQNRYLHLNYLFMFLLGYSLINHIFKHFFFHINFSLVIYSCFYGSLQGKKETKILKRILIISLSLFEIIIRVMFKLN